MWVTFQTENHTWKNQASFLKYSKHSMNIISHTESSFLTDWELLEKYVNIWYGDPQIFIKWKKEQLNSLVFWQISFLISIEIWHEVAICKSI